MRFQQASLTDLRVAVVLPCYNEEKAIAQVVSEFKDALPEAGIYVFDNNSTDRTAEVARAAGAKVTHVELKGKGNVLTYFLQGLRQSAPAAG